MSITDEPLAVLARHTPEFMMEMIYICLSTLTAVGMWVGIRVPE